MDVDDVLYRGSVVVGDDRFRLDDVLDTAGVGGNSHPGHSHPRVSGGRPADDGSLLLVLLVGEAALSKYIGHVEPSLGVRSLLPVRSPVRRGLGPSYSSSGQPPSSPHLEGLVKSPSLQSEPLAQDGLLLFVHDGNQFVINYRQLGLGEGRHLIL